MQTLHPFQTESRQREIESALASRLTDEQEIKLFIWIADNTAKYAEEYFAKLPKSS
jgi:hypothetical protein